ncbi:hypothetical protein GGS23DRAFT_202801 [Durotheca rogersii]|uniref:uncharacterized protein n=1 Tax=Durotheca rogersii TaxID=419775 RepID=UPI00221F44EA|nr:uncharacterized protein GGS23DRAFT_202801 [Durotheca rogersii]KAI5860957.1 hypothetical protein GGS23DRAFT_202801 [Durotheca rogersii]
MASPAPMDICEPVAESAEEWTTVHHRGRRTKTHRPIPLRSREAALTSQPLPSSLSVADIEREHRRIADQWKTSACRRQLEEIILSRICNSEISEAICLGLGSFDPDNGSWEAKRTAHVQLAAFLYIADMLRPPGSSAIPCIFQEPFFNSADKAFIRSLGHEVVDSPEGFERVGASTFVFGVHLYRDIYLQAIASHIPRIFVGTPFHIWQV